MTGDPIVNGGARTARRNCRHLKRRVTHRRVLWLFRRGRWRMSRTSAGAAAAPLRRTPRQDPSKRLRVDERRPDRVGVQRAAVRLGKDDRDARGRCAHSSSPGNADGGISVGDRRRRTERSRAPLLQLRAAARHGRGRRRRAHLRDARGGTGAGRAQPEKPAIVGKRRCGG